MTVGDSKRNSGFTLIELLVTIAVAIILVTLAVPNFSDLVRRNKFTVASNDVLSSLIFARNEAIRNKLSVTVDLGAANGWPLDIVLKDTVDEVIVSRDSPMEDISISWSSSPGAEFSPLGRFSGEVSLCFFLNGVREKEIRILPSGQIIPKDRGVFENCS